MVENETGVGAKYKFRDEDWTRLQKIHGKKKANELKTKARERQRELAAIQEEMPESVRAIQERQRPYQESQQAWQQIQDDPQFAPIKDLPLLNVFKDAYHYETPEGEMRKLSKHPDKKVAALLEQRQKAIEDAGFGDIISSQAHKMARGVGDRPAWIGGTERGRFAAIDPLYYDADSPMSRLEAPDVARFASITPGIDPTLGNVLGEADIASYNRLQQLLGEGGDVITQTDPWGMGTYDLDVNRYLEEEARNRRTREAELDALRKSYLQNFRTETGGKFI
jgi:hypothetical protein